MEKFSLNENINQDKYAGNDVLRNKINNLIIETLSAKVDNTLNSKVTINGADELVEELHKYISSRIINARIQKLIEFKNNPTSWKMIDTIKKEPTLNINENVKFEAFDVINEGVIVNRKYTDVSLTEGKDWIYYVETVNGVFPIRDYHVTKKVNEDIFWANDINLKYVEEHPEADDKISNSIKNLKKEIDNISNNIPNSRFETMDIVGVDNNPCGIVKIDGVQYNMFQVNEINFCIENYIIDNTSSNGFKPGYNGTANEIAEIINISTVVPEKKVEENKINLFEVIEDEFNRSNYPYLIGKKYITKPNYVLVKVVEGTVEQASDYKN